MSDGTGRLGVEATGSFLSGWPFEALGQGDNPRFDVPLKRVKKRRVIQQPLSDLAVEIIREALKDGKEHFFASPIGDQPMYRKVMATDVPISSIQLPHCAAPSSKMAR